MKSLISTMLGTASRALPKNSRQTVRVCAGMRCTTQRALVIRPSQPSFWMPGRPERNLSVTSLPRPSLRKAAPGIVQRLGAHAASVLPSASKYCSSKLATRRSWILPRLWSRRVTSSHSASRRDHAPGHQVVQRRAPQHGLLAAGVHGDVAADAGGLGRGRVDREHEAGALGRVGHALRDHAGLGPDRRHRLRPGRAMATCSTSVMASSFSVLITALFQVSGMAPPV